MDTVNTFIDSRGVLGALLVAAITTGAGLFWRSRRPAREISWGVLYDEPINQGQDQQSDPHQNQGPNFWDIQFRNKPVKQGSLVLLRVRNAGETAIKDEDFRPGLSFRFGGRQVLGFKVRDHHELHRLVEAARVKEAEEEARRAQALPQGESPAKVVRTELTLPTFLFNPGSEFKLLVLLQAQPRSQADVDVRGEIVDGKIARHDVRRPPYRLIAVGTALAVLIAGITLGVRLANDALTPTAACSGGSLTLEGSSAFAPVANQVRNNYRQLCGQNATITITADGSERGLASLEHSRSSTLIAMSDGLPASQAGTETLVRRPVGVVTFAVVANTALRATLPDLFSQNGVSEDELRSLFTGAHASATPRVTAVGRTHASGTRAAFAGAFFGGVDPEPGTAAACGPGTTQGFCTSDNTMDLLSFVESHPDAIGYAEADALPYFPDVQVIAVDGQLPSAQSVTSAGYPFVATEYLYTAGQPAGLVADYLQFLTSPAESAALRGHGFIACGDLSGTKRDGACSG
ncbi:PstS family phosphate ABC transporter substrate-binding protein [Streptacidiphilus anmyonensis]|uniref:PstS family phosphate ABC transporter substrate-binding protein n=1 Tax=Streptacidiphilus anmyonensis TaxID=405782 RepID=UPI0013648D6A|nr:substrate-binding domain-containing protein [Streptacidiphilus anmyonensis]